jgi:hypothetical protein
MLAGRHRRARQTASWFPLYVGNTWLYRSGTSSGSRGNFVDFQSISVEEKETIAGREYFDVAYFGQDLLLRVEPSDGSVILLDRISGTDVGHSWTPGWRHVPDSH